jgi:hypothetical protein
MEKLQFLINNLLQQKEKGPEPEPTPTLKLANINSEKNKEVFRMIEIFLQEKSQNTKEDSKIKPLKKGKGARRNDEPSLTSNIMKALFETDQIGKAVQDLFSVIGKKNKGVCGKILKKNDVGFKCLNCEMDPTCIICKECFEKGNHKGHRVILQQSCNGCCDCGDKEAW